MDLSNIQRTIIGKKMMGRIYKRFTLPKTQHLEFHMQKH